MNFKPSSFFWVIKPTMENPKLQLELFCNSLIPKKTLQTFECVDESGFFCHRGNFYNLQNIMIRKEVQVYYFTVKFFRDEKDSSQVKFDFKQVEVLFSKLIGQVLISNDFRISKESYQDILKKSLVYYKSTEDQICELKKQLIEKEIFHNNEIAKLNETHLKQIQILKQSYEAEILHITTLQKDPLIQENKILLQSVKDESKLDKTATGILNNIDMKVDLSVEEVQYEKENPFEDNINSFIHDNIKMYKNIVQDSKKDKPNNKYVVRRNEDGKAKFKGSKKIIKDSNL